MQHKKGAHTKHYLKYHFVWAVKYRKGLLNKKGVVGWLKYILYEIEKRYDIWFDKIGTDGDHIHLLLQSVTRYSPADIARIVKSISAREIFKKFPEVRRLLWKGEFWEDGYYVSTVGGDKTEEIISRYIANQGKRKPSAGEGGQLTFFGLH